MDFLQKYFCGVFELPLPRNAQKRAKKKSEEKMFWGWLVPRKFNRFISTLNYAPRYFPSRDFRLP
jgi:hypothetical protein